MAEQSPKKKVFIAITKSNWGGAQRYVYDVARSLPRETYDVVVAHGGNGLMAQKLREKRVRTIEIPALERDVNIFKDFESFSALLRVIKMEQPDVLHLNSSKVGLFGACAGRVAGVPKIVFTAHGWPFNEERSRIARAVFYLFARITIALSHRTVSVSDAVARAVGGPSKKNVVIKNGIELPTFLGKKDARTKLISDASLEEFWAGIVAELHPTKGIVHAIEAFKQFAAKNPRARLVVLGDGEDRKRLFSRIQILQLEKQVHLLGFVRDAEAYLRAFDVFLLPSLSEGLSYSILEAGASGIPVIASRVGGIPEIIEHNETGVLVPAKDCEALTSALEKIATDESFRAKIGDALYERVTSEFTLSTMMEKTQTIYSE